MNPPLAGLIVLASLFCSAMFGMRIGRILPEHHLTDQTKGVITVSTGMIGTLTAFFLGLLIAAASSSFSTKNQEVVNIGADVIEMDHLLRRYGPEAQGSRDLLRRYTAMKTQDFFPEGTTKLPNLNNPRTNALLEELQDKLVALDPSNVNQRWLQSQAIQLVTKIGGHDGFWSSKARLGSLFRYWSWWYSGCVSSFSASPFSRRVTRQLSRRCSSARSRPRRQSI